MKLDPCLIANTKINPKWVKDLNIRPETSNLLKENRGKKPLIWTSAMSFQLTSKAQETKTKINKWDYIKPKSLCTAKETINKTKRQPTDWEKKFANHISDKRLLFKIYKELINSTAKKKKKKKKTHK